MHHLATAAALIAMTIVSPGSVVGMEKLKWRVRPVIVFAGAGDAATDQVARLKRDRATLDEREMEVFVVGENDVMTLTGAIWLVVGQAP